MRSGLTPTECARLRDLLAAQEGLNRLALTPAERTGSSIAATLKRLSISAAEYDALSAEWASAYAGTPKEGALGRIRIKLTSQISALRKSLARAAKGGR